jgi:DMSO reductase family type II enzyme heme b subunit
MTRADDTGCSRKPALARALAAVTLGVFVSGAAAAPPADDAKPARGAELFALQCSACHGAAGDGAGPFAYLMNPRPRNFLAGKFKLATTQNQVPTDDDLLRTITRGMPGSAMPPWGHLRAADLRALVGYVRKLHGDAVRAEVADAVKRGVYAQAEAAELLAARTQPGAPLAMPPEPPFDDLRWFRGRRVYVEACAACHGADGQPVAEAVKFDDEGFPDPPRSFVNGVFKGSSEGHQLYCRIVKGMPGTPMPAFEGAYTPEQVWDLVHYVQSLARTGAQDRAQLRQMTIAAPQVASLPSGPTDAAWDQAQPAYVALTPLWWTADRVEGLIVQAVHDQGELALRLSWLDTTADERAVRTDEFRDAVAIQFSSTSDPPFYMGDKTDHGAASIWMWKADRQKNLASGYQDVDAAFPSRAVDMYPECPIRAKDMSLVDWPHGTITEHVATFITAWGAGNLIADPTLKTAVESLEARGPGTLAGRPLGVQVVQSQAVFEHGAWTVQLQGPLESSGARVPVALAIWNGAAGDRDGKKNISIWQTLVLE